MNILNIQKATVYRSGNKVFDNLNLTIKNGDNTAIVGPNGAGKTTLMKMLSREIYPVYARDCLVEIFGREKWNVWELRLRLGLVSPDLQQNYAANAKGLAVVLSGFYSSVDVWGHMEFDNEQMEKTHRILHELGITHLQEHTYASMSTGEQRRHLLARALINEPEALILDEPTTGLDLPATFQYLETVRGLMQQGKTLVLVTHHIHEIPPEITQVVLIKKGKVMAHGAKQDVLSNKNLTELFEVPIQMVTANGYYQVLPGQVLPG